MEFLNKAPFITAENWLEKTMSPLPKLPKKWIEFLVKILPILVLIGGVASVFSAISWFTWSNGVRNAWWWRGGSWVYVEMVLSLIVGVALLMAYKPLKDKQMLGVRILLWTGIIRVVDLFYGVSLGSILGILIGIYLTLQLKPAYKKQVEKTK